MEPTRPMPLRDAAAPPATLAKQFAMAALRRLALAKLEPTPENFARAYDEEQGVAPRPVLPARALPLLQRMAGALLREEAGRDALVQSFVRGRWQQAEQQLDALAGDDGARADGWAALIEKLVAGVERGSRQWTRARRKDGVQRVLAGSRGDAQRLQHRLSQLVASWEGDADDATLAEGGESPIDAVPESLPAEAATARPLPRAEEAPDLAPWSASVTALGDTVQCALPIDTQRGGVLAASLQGVLARVDVDGATSALAEALMRDCEEARSLMRQRQQAFEQMRTLCNDLADGLTEIAEDESWAQGQCKAMRARLAEEPTARALRSAGELLRETRQRQRDLRHERQKARDALKLNIQQMLAELGELGVQTGRFQESVGRHADVVESADSLESLAGAVRRMVAESRAMHEAVGQTQQRLQDEHARAAELAERVRSLEDELRQLSDEVSTDPLTQIANRRGLQQAFEVESARAERNGVSIAIALLDIDNFKKLNDRLGHGAGDQALKALAERVKQQLRPVDAVARYGGEEFVVMLPDATIEQGREVLTRMQRALTAALFMHDEEQVFVTFSAGLTLYRAGESIEQALDRADEALYEAKRTGKNRTCAG
jgi:diguanylate cyclase